LTKTDQARTDEKAKARSDTVARTKDFAVAPAQAVVTVVAPIAKPVQQPKPALERWMLSPSDITLRKALAKWAARAGWQLMWEASDDVPLTVSATFEGDFRTAVRLLFLSLRDAGVNLNARPYKGNTVLRVVESGRRSQ
jgi:hypothetical protein